MLLAGWPRRMFPYGLLKSNMHHSHLLVRCFSFLLEGLEIPLGLTATLVRRGGRFGFVCCEGSLGRYSCHASVQVML